MAPEDAGGGVRICGGEVEMRLGRRSDNRGDISRRGGGGGGCGVFFFKQKTAYEIVSRDWSSDVCSSDLFSKQRYHNDHKSCSISDSRKKG